MTVCSYDSAVQSNLTKELMQVRKGKGVKGLTRGYVKRLPGEDSSLHMSNFSVRVEEVLHTFLSLF